MNNCVEIRDVSFCYPGDDAPTLKHISLSVEEKEFLAVIGSNGSGKSTLCKLLNGLIPQYYTGDFDGEVSVCGLDPKSSTVAELSNHVGYVFQNFENQIVQARVLEDAAFAPLNRGLADYRERAANALGIVGLSRFQDDFVWQLSGGQKHLLALAGCLATEPDILVIDEPSAQLDPYHAGKIYDVLKKLNKDYGKTIIVIEHHTELIAEYCSSVVLIDKGTVVWKKPVRQALSEVGLLTSLNIYPPQITQAAEKLAKGGQLPVMFREGVQFFKKRRHGAIPAYAEQNTADPRETVVSFERVDFSYQMIGRIRKQILKNINISFHKGERVAIVGNNGAGKSTLMRLITGIKKPESGRILIHAQNISELTPEQIADSVAYIYQNPEEMFIDDSVQKDISFFPRTHCVAGYERRVHEIMQQFNLMELQDKDSRLMSGGQQRRATLAIGAAMEPSVILLDEPTASLDMATRKDLTEFIFKLKDRIDLIMIATHDMQLVSEWATRVIVLHQGEVIYDGDRQTLFSRPFLMRKAGLVPPQIVALSHALNIEPAPCSVASFIRLFTEGESPWRPSKTLPINSISNS